MRLHWREGSSIDRLAGMFRIHGSTAARSLERVRELLLERTRRQRHMADRAGLRGGELGSGLRHIQSRLDESLSRRMP
jgi:hypothetical protein